MRRCTLPGLRGRTRARHSNPNRVSTIANQGVHDAGNGVERAPARPREIQQQQLVRICICICISRTAHHAPHEELASGASVRLHSRTPRALPLRGPRRASIPRSAASAAASAGGHPHRRRQAEGPPGALRCPRGCTGHAGPRAAAHARRGPRRATAAPRGHVGRRRVARVDEHVSVHEPLERFDLALNREVINGGPACARACLRAQEAPCALKILGNRTVP